MLRGLLTAEGCRPPARCEQSHIVWFSYIIDDIVPLRSRVDVQVCVGPRRRWTDEIKGRIAARRPSSFKRRRSRSRWAVAEAAARRPAMISIEISGAAVPALSWWRRRNRWTSAETPTVSPRCVRATPPGSRERFLSLADRSMILAGRIRTEAAVETSGAEHVLLAADQGCCDAALRLRAGGRPRAEIAGAASNTVVHINHF